MQYRSPPVAAPLGLAAILALMALGPAAAGEPSKLSAAFGNTVVSTYPDGRTQRIWLRPDGAWDGVSRTGKQIGGRWTLKDNKVCLRQTRPLTIPISFCTDFPGDAGVGANWTSHDISGTPIRLKVVPGMAEALNGG